MNEIIKIVDSTRYQTALNCPREQYWLTEYEGRGIVPSTPNEHMVFGSAIHESYEALFLGKPLKTAVKAGLTYLMKNMPDIGLTPDGHPRVTEYAALLEGSVTCFAETQLEGFLAKYKVHPGNVEKEIVIPLGEQLQGDTLVKVLYATRLDVLLINKEDDRPFNLNIKSTQYMGDLERDMEFSAQLMMESAAASIHLGTPVTATVVLGLDKGRLKTVTEREERMGLQGKRLLGPLTYAYKKDTGFTPEYRHDYASGWQRVPAWVDPGLKKWLKLLPVEVKQSRTSYITIFHDPARIEDLKEQIFHEAVRRAVPPTKDQLNRLYPQNFKNCNKHAGFFHHACPYKEPCLEGFVDIGGAFSWRDANHPIEEALWEEE